MLTRRDWLKMTGAAYLGTFAVESAEAAPTNSKVAQIAMRNGAKGWALWDGNSRTEGWNTKERSGVLSIAKMLAGLAVTRAVADGKLALDEPLYLAIPEWKADPAKRKITTRMLLQQTSGLENGGSKLYRGVLADKGRTALALKVVNTPGTYFRYGASHWEVLAEYLQRKLGGESLEKYLHRSVLRAIGISTPEWRSDEKGRFFLSTGPKFTVEDLGKLGRMLGKLLRGENVDGFKADVFANVTKTSAANPMFGGGLWRNIQAKRPGARSIEVEDSIDPSPDAGFWTGTCLSTRHPTDLVGLVGSSGQRVFIWPSRNRVFARLGKSRSWSDKALLDVMA